LAQISDLVIAPNHCLMTRSIEAAPDVFQASLDKLGVRAAAALPVGDTRFDVEAANASTCGRSHFCL